MKEERKEDLQAFEEPNQLPVYGSWTPSFSNMDMYGLPFWCSDEVGRDEESSGVLDGYSAERLHPDFSMQFQSISPLQSVSSSPILEAAGYPILDSRPDDVSLSSKARGRNRKKPSTCPKQRTNKRSQMERNKMSARESRRRKKEYVLGLEEEIRRLRTELSENREKLHQYELIEKQRHLSNLDTYKLMKESSLRTSMPNPEKLPNIQHESVETLLLKFHSESQERRLARDQLIRIGLDVLLSPPHRYLLWAAENDSGVFAPQKSGQLERENSDAPRQDIFELSDDERKSVAESKEFFKDAAKKFREYVKALLSDHKKLQDVLKLVDCHIYTHFISKFRLPSFRAYLHFVDSWTDSLELSNTNLFQIEDQEFFEDYPLISARESTINSQPEVSILDDLLLWKRPHIM